MREGLEVCVGRPPAGCYLMDYCGMSRECAPNGRQHAHGSGWRLPILYLRGSFARAGGRDVLLASSPLPNPAFLGLPFCGVRSINRGPSGPGRPLLAEVLRGSPSVLGGILHVIPEYLLRPDIICIQSPASSLIQDTHLRMLGLKESHENKSQARLRTLVFCPLCSEYLSRGQSFLTYLTRTLPDVTKTGLDILNEDPRDASGNANLE